MSSRLNVIDNRLTSLEEQVRVGAGGPAPVAQPPPPALPGMPDWQYPLQDNETLLLLNNELGDAATRACAVCELCILFFRGGVRGWGGGGGAGDGGGGAGDGGGGGGRIPSGR